MRGIRLVHTADWHLGHSLRGHGRAREHRAFLSWLVELCVEREVDALLVAGDVFDRGHPPASAQQMWFDFLAELHEATREPRPVTVIAIAGNHDAPSRLTAPSALLRGKDVHVVGGVGRSDDGTIDAESMVFPLRGRGADADGRVLAYALAVPFLRPHDLRAVDLPDAERSELVAGAPLDAARGARAVYEAVLAQARRCGPEPVVALGHAHLVGCEPSLLSERRVLLGGEEALSHRVFPDGIDYVALGHLHRAQRVSRKREDRRYSGSPIPLSMAETGYHHQVVVVDLPAPGETGAEVRIDPVAIPRAVDLLRLPDGGPAGPDDVEAALRALPERGEAVGPEERDGWPFVEARVRIDKPEPGLRTRIEEAIADRAARLVRIDLQRVGGDRRALDAAGTAQRTLSELTPEEVFARRWASQHGGEPPVELQRAFLDLWAQCEEEASA